MSFEISSETIEKSFNEYDVSGDEIEQNPVRFTLAQVNRNPVQKTINDLAKLHVNARLSLHNIRKIIPIINQTAKMCIPNGKKILKQNINHSFETVFYAKCSACDEIGEVGICSNCKAIIKKGDNFFIYFPIGDQIKGSLIKHFDTIMEYGTRFRAADLTDIDDSEIQKAIAKEYPSHHILSLTMNIDGGQVIEKGGHSLYPVQLYQNYLPPTVRFLSQNIIVAALYFAKGKPNMFDFMYPLLQDLNQLFQESIQLMYDGKQYDFLPLVLFCSCDLPARAQIQNFKGATGRNACPHCLHPGQPNKEDRIRFRYAKEENPSKLRTHDETVQDAHNKSNGVKGISCMLTAPEFNIIDGFTSDSMHGVFLGVMKRLMSIWLGDLKVTTFKHLNNRDKQTIDESIHARG